MTFSGFGSSSLMLDLPPTDFCLNLSNMKLPHLIAISILIAVSLASLKTIAHDGATGIVKERMVAMKSIRDRLKSVAAMIKGEEPFNSEKLATLADEIGAHGGDSMIKKFPKGSIHGPSEALPAIWEDWEEFRRLAFKLSKTSDDLANAAITSPNRPPVEAFKALASTCKSCHDDFRKRQ